MNKANAMQTNARKMNWLHVSGLSGSFSVHALAIVLLAPLGQQLQALLGLGLLPLLAFLGGALTTTLVYLLGTREGGTSVTVMLLAGVAITALSGAVIGLLTYLADDQMLRNLSLWQMGSLAAGKPVDVALALLTLAALLLLFARDANPLNALLLGEGEARHLGVNVQALKRRLILLTAAGVGVAVAVAGFQQSAWIQEYRQQGLARADTSCHNTLHKKCVWGAEGEPPWVLMLGDSHADQYKTFIDAMGKKEGWSAKLVSADTCAFVRKYDARVLHNNASCRNVHQYADEHLAEYPIVMLAMRWGNQIKADKLSVGYDEQFFDKLDATLTHFAAENKTVYLFTDNPAIQYSALRAYKLQHNLPMWAPVRTLHKQDDNVDAGNAAMRAVAAKHGNVHIVDAQAFLPDNFLFNGKPVYADLDHINPFAGAELAKRYGARFSLLPSGLQTKQTQAAR